MRWRYKVIGRKDREEDIKAKRIEEEAEEAPPGTGEVEKEEAKKDGSGKKGPVTVDRLEYERLKEAVRLSEEFKDKYLRAHAELDNTRKRFVREREEFVKYANEELLSEILHIVDNFDRALEHMNSSQKVESILEGIKMIQKQFHLLLELKGVKRIEAVGRKFDPVLHEAVGHVEVEEDKDGIVLEEVQTGYMLNGRLLRPATVKVGKKK